MCLLHTKYTHLPLWMLFRLDNLNMHLIRLKIYLLHMQYIQLLLRLLMCLLHMQHMLGRLFYNHLRN